MQITNLEKNFTEVIEKLSDELSTRYRLFSGDKFVVSVQSKKALSDANISIIYFLKRINRNNRRLRALFGDKIFHKNKIELLLKKYMAASDEATMDKHHSELKEHRLTQNAQNPLLQHEGVQDAIAQAKNKLIATVGVSAEELLQEEQMFVEIIRGESVLFLQAYKLLVQQNNILNDGSAIEEMIMQKENELNKVIAKMEKILAPYQILTTMVHKTVSGTDIDQYVNNPVRFIPHPENTLWVVVKIEAEIAAYLRAIEGVSIANSRKSDAMSSQPSQVASSEDSQPRQTSSQSVGHPSSKTLDSDKGDVNKNDMENNDIQRWFSLILNQCKYENPGDPVGMIRDLLSRTNTNSLITLKLKNHGGHDRSYISTNISSKELNSRKSAILLISTSNPSKFLAYPELGYLLDAEEKLDFFGPPALRYRVQYDTILEFPILEDNHHGEFSVVTKGKISSTATPASSEQSDADIENNIAMSFSPILLDCVKRYEDGYSITEARKELLSRTNTNSLIKLEIAPMNKYGPFDNPLFPITDNSENPAILLISTNNPSKFLAFPELNYVLSGHEKLVLFGQPVFDYMVRNFEGRGFPILEFPILEKDDTHRGGACYIVRREGKFIPSLNRG